MFLVTGATGGLGRRVVKTLLRRQFPVRAFVRLSSRYHDLEQMGAEIFIGDLRRKASIDKAVQGTQYIISAHGANASGAGDAAQIDYQANIDLIDAAQANGVKHFVFVSVLGADRDYDDAPVFKAKREVEKYLARSGLTHTILRPSGFASNLLPLARTFRRTGLYLLIGKQENRTSIVSTDDLAEIAVRSVSIAEARNRIFAVGGPEALRRDEISKIFEKLFNRSGMLINVPLEVFDGARALLRLFNPSLGRDLGTLRTLLANEYTCNSREVQQVFGMDLESLHHFLRRNLSTLEAI